MPISSDSPSFAETYLQTITAMVAIKDTKKVAAWSSYWSEGNTTSLPNLFAENYSGDVSRFWDEAFIVLTGNSRALDICTGNGAIALLAKENVNRRNICCEIHAIDVAEIHPTNLKNDDTSINDVKFHSGVAVEKTHFPDKYFDLVIGQFALEYCDIVGAIKELSRIIRDGGGIVLMVHHSDSVTVASTNELISIADIFLKEPTIFFRLRKYAEQYSHHKKLDTPKLIQKRQQLIASINNTHGLIKQFPKNRFLQATLNNIKQLAEGVHNVPSDGTKEIREFEKIVKYHVIRMQDQRDAALNNEKMAEVESLFRQHGFRSVRYEPFHLDDVLFSWAFRARRSNRK